VEPQHEPPACASSVGPAEHGAGPVSVAADLRRVHVFADLDDEQIAWLGAHARWVIAEGGEVVFREGAPASDMMCVVEGELHFRREQGPPDGRLVVRRAGDVTGMLPSSRLTRSPSTGRAVVRTRVAYFASSLFPEMLERIPELRERLAAVMVDRSREYTRHDEQRERLLSLGKLAAGLAHELNNPAAAIQRTAGELERRLGDLSAVARALLEPVATAAGLQPLARLGEGGAAAPTDPLARADAEDALAAWLDAHGVPDAYLAAETLVAAGITAHDLEAATRGVPDDGLTLALRWFEADVGARRLLASVGHAAQRVSELIQTIKVYANMDRAPDRDDIDVHEGLRSTLTVLAPRFRERGVRVTLEFDPDLPAVTGNPGELNQVWTNLLENALEAAPEGGEVAVRTRAAEEHAIVQVVDDGPGVPAELRTRIFEPFFTTKDVGEGTGLGLDLVRRIVQGHRGEVQVDSEAGRTCFEVRLPATRGREPHTTG